MGELNWNGEAFMEHLADRYSQRLDVAAEAVAQKMRDLIAEPYPPASRPGEPPHKRTGNLRQSIRWTAPAPLVRQIGSSVPYALFLEYGTGRMGARPFILRALVECMGEIRQVIVEGELSAVA